MENIFEIKDKFYYNKEAVQIISGGIHYFRIVPEYWRDRLEKLKNMGCNTVETYVPWNLHEPKKGTFCFEGMADLKRFIELAGELELFVIIRPSPYICAEWEFGGLPGWLLAEDGMKLRCSDKRFLKHVEEYYKTLFQILTPLQINYGGPIIMMQVENEYGGYGDDTKYLETLRDLMIENGVVVPLVTSDGPWENMLECGAVKGVHLTANFGSAAEHQLKVLGKHTDGPLMCMEFWVGWFDHWGSEKHQTSDLKQNITDLSYFLEKDNVNIYMFEGGTNFGFMNGANYYDKLTPDVTSYDYDAVLTESGQITKKYEEFQALISTKKKLPQIPLSTVIQTKAYGKIDCAQKTGLFENLNNLTKCICDLTPSCMEKLGQNFGYILYESVIEKDKDLNKIYLIDTNDRASIFIDNTPVLTLYDRELLEEHQLDIKDIKGKTLRILVENMGRVNFGPRLEYQRKGIDGGIWLNGHFHFYWNQYTLPFEQLEQLDFSKGYQEGLPAFYRFYFDIEELGDTYLDVTGFGKGCAFMNGFNLGRFWEIGPQMRLYLPAPLLKRGRNELILFETEGKANDFITLEDSPKLE